jgi:hypothetical protein
MSFVMETDGLHMDSDKLFRMHISWRHLCLQIEKYLNKKRVFWYDLAFEHTSIFACREKHN